MGREKERTELIHSLDHAAEGHGGLVMLGGEPGVGKTRLAEEVLAEAGRRGYLALTGRCYENEGAQPYSPFIRAGRGCRAPDRRRRHEAGPRRGRRRGSAAGAGPAPALPGAFAASRAAARAGAALPLQQHPRLRRPGVGHPANLRAARRPPLGRRGLAAAPRPRSGGPRRAAGAADWHLPRRRAGSLPTAGADP